jgi:probable FeS assembly SUF system protein SufT
MNMREEVTLTRSAEAVMIPSGERVLVPQGAHATITQSLGGSYTIITDRGLMVRISGKEVEAIGKSPEGVVDVKEGEEVTPEKLEELVWDQLKTCYDPEIPVNIVDLGLVYSMEITPGDAGSQVDVKMTLTAPGCGMGASIASDARYKLLALPGVGEANVDLVWDPPWNPQMISPEGKERLGMA